MQVSLADKYAFGFVERAYENNGKNKKDKNGQERFIIDSNLNRENNILKNREDTIEEDIVIKKKDIENILYLVINKGVSIKNAKEVSGMYINEHV